MSKSYFETNNTKFPVDEFIACKNKDTKLHKTNAYDSLEMQTFIYDKKKGVRQFCKFKKGHCEKPHYHSGSYEWFVISGKFNVKNPVTNKEIILESGDYYYNPNNVPHTEVCIEDGDVFWIYNGEHDYHTL